MPSISDPKFMYGLAFKKIVNIYYLPPKVCERLNYKGASEYALAIDALKKSYPVVFRKIDEHSGLPEYLSKRLNKVTQEGNLSDEKVNQLKSMCENDPKKLQKILQDADKKEKMDSIISKYDKYLSGDVGF